MERAIALSLVERCALEQRRQQNQEVGIMIGWRADAQRTY